MTRGARADRRPGVRSCLGALVVLAAVRPIQMQAQTDARLAGAVRLAQEGLSDSARAVVGRLLAAMTPADSLYPEALYTMGFVAATEADRRLHLRRVVVDFAQSAWADDALLQLAQLDYAAGRSDATVRQVEQLLRDYPATPLAAVASLWGARAAGDRRDGPGACRLADAGLAAVGGDVELRNQLDFQKQRCLGLSAMAVTDSIDRARADSVARTGQRRGQPPVQSSTRPSAGFYVQVSAVRTQSAANTEIARIRRAGYAAVTAREAGLLKIRVGPYPDRADASAAAADLRTKLGARPFVVRVP